MPEPDFDQIARRITSIYGEIHPATAIAGPEIVELLRQAWNARGAADLAKLREGYFSVDAEQTIERALRTLDR